MLPPVRSIAPTLLLCAIAVACGGGSAATRTAEPGAAAAPAKARPPQAKAAGDGRRTCLAAQKVEVEAWLRDMVTTPGDELETWATLQMIMTITEPEVLEEIRFANPEASDAAARSEKTWKACHDLIEVNCASLSRAMELTEARLEPDIFDHRRIEARCEKSEVSPEQAECALEAADPKVARGCF